MNRKIKVINLLNKIANGEEVPKRIKSEGREFWFKEDETSIDYLYRTDKNGNGWIVVQDMTLTDEVEILEDNTEEIEELNAYKLMETPYMANLLKEQRYDEFMEHLKQSEVEIADKLMKLIWAIKEIRKERE